MRSLALLFAGLAFSAAAQSPSGEILVRSTLEGIPALVLSNDKLELTILTQGGAFANLALRDDPEKLSPYWNPRRMAREAGRRPPTGFEAGHFVCVDGFGPVSEQERAAGLPGHGEANKQAWRVVAAAKSGKTASVTFSVDLPLVEERFTRTVRLVDGENVVYVESGLESLLAFDRPICWAEHATIGSPFLEPGKTAVDLPAIRAKTRPHDPKPGPLPHRLASSVEFTWPMAPGGNGQPIDLRAAPLNPNSGDHTTALMDVNRKWAFVTALHPEKRLLLGYLFHPQEYPWVQNWENYPPTLKMARGFEFGTQPFDVPRREVIDLHSMFDAPVYRWLPAKSRIESRFLFFYTRTPDGFQRVNEMSLEQGVIRIEDRTAAKSITLSASLEP